MTSVHCNIGVVSSSLDQGTYFYTEYSLPTTDLIRAVDIFHLRETNVRQKIAQLIFSLHKDIVFCQVVIPYKG